MNKKVLSFDLDNVIRDSVGKVCELAFRKYGIQLYRDQFNVWDPALGHLLGISEEEFIQFAWCNPAIFNLAAPMPDAVNVLRSLPANEYSIIINTANQFPSITYSWLNNKLIPYDEVVHTSNKLEVHADVHVDDSPAVLELLHNAGRKVIRFASLPWNAHLNGKYPVANNWLELKSLLV